MEPPDVDKMTYERLVKYTNNFSESNYVGHFQFGKYYRGVIPWLPVRDSKHLMVKIYEDPEIYNCNILRLMDEIILLRHEMFFNHPGMVKLHGYCREGNHLAAVYLFKPFDSVFNLIPKDGFTWLQRIKVALGLASLLRFLHTRKSSFYDPFIVRNLDAAHIVLDEDYNPKLCDFGSITGGIFADRTKYKGHHVPGCYGYVDSASGDCSNKQDVFAFGVILLSLISKKVYTEENRQAGVPFVYQWARKEYESAVEMEKPMFSLVHESLAKEPVFCPADGHKITMLALECVNGGVDQRPTMKQVYRSLKKLEVVKGHAPFLGLDSMVQKSGTT
ncbi:hypothetical protein BUALT_Bualt03G0221400 [Buddleja alternifolia]|uniref:Protein kinase domain-containing protein n=1 Tax=Buddleja alternifolia TaxID=168488 RepID=A0AAV6XVT9_9LAMI|nr:hypothetical protein BUALT_Bualt03G0221400 [Buddleja alternifolia]